jgi:hypothetical protein
LLTVSVELELKVPSREETGSLTSRAGAREVLDVHAVEFSKTGRLDAGTKKASDSREGPSWK